MYVKYDNKKQVVKFPYTADELYAEYPNVYFGPHLTSEILPDLMWRTLS